MLIERNNDKKPSLCIVCSNIYPLFDARIKIPTGGMEARAALFARGLAAQQKWHLDIVVSDFGQSFVTRHEDIDFHIYQPTYRKAGRNVFPRLRQRRWLPSLNLDRRDLDLLWQIPMIAVWLALPTLFFPRFWRELKPDVVCCFGNNERTAEVIADCHHAGIKTVLLLAHDDDVSPELLDRNSELNGYGMPKWKGYYSIINADCIVSQTETQRESLRRHFGRKATLIRNPVHVSENDPQYWPTRNKREYVLWIGRSDTFHKRPMIFLNLARNCPDLQFVMIMNRTDGTLFQSLGQARPDNLRIIDHVPSDEIWDYYRHARVFVNTSKSEGFPNTFLQAAVIGVPIVSLEVDPDGMLSSQGCGIVAQGNLNRMHEAVVALCADDIYAETLAAACYRYVFENHESSARIAELECCLETQLISRSEKVPWWKKWRRFIRASGVKGGPDVY